MAKIPQKNAEFFFDSERPPVEFVVSDMSVRMARAEGGAPRDPYRHLNGSLGAHCAWWLDGESATSTPEGVFGSVVLARLPERQAVADALKKFAEVEGCEWAERMLAGMREEEWSDSEEA